MKLLIIESPGKKKKLAAILGKEWNIAASVGHIRDLPVKDMGVYGPDFEPHYVLTKRGGEVVENLKKLVNAADEVYLGTDPDREGESISWHLKECLKLKNPIRITFNEITKNAVEKALKSPRKIDTKLVMAQEARRVLDRIVGYGVSSHISSQKGLTLSAGRVQSPAIWLVVDRERAIKAFKVTKHFGAMLYFSDNGEEWSAEWLTKPDFVTDESPYFMDKIFSEKVSEIKKVEVLSFKETEAKRSPPPPFTTSTMQQAASVALGLDPKAAMDAAQKLYEQGHITYHRTDNPNVSDDALDDIRAVALKLGLEMAEKMRKFKAPEGAQVGHPAITPTHWEVEEAGESDIQKKLYGLIRLRAIACQLADARYAVRTVRLKSADQIPMISNDGKEVEFEGKGRKLIFGGWLQLIDSDQTEEKEEDFLNPIPICQPEEIIAVSQGKMLEKKTKPPSRYTQATLIKKLESEGIGRPATYAAIMENITGRKYVENKKKNLVPTSTGELVIDALENKFSFLELKFTRNVEEDFDRIAKGEMQYKEVVGKMNEVLEKEMSVLPISKHSCHICKSPLRRINGKNGPFWACIKFPDCKFTLPDSNGEPGQKKEAALSEYKCPNCQKSLVHRVKKGAGGYDFWGCSGFKEGCKTSFKNKDDAPDFKEKK